MSWDDADDPYEEAQGWTYGDEYGDITDPGDDEIETRPCPNCGAAIYEDTPACPACGEYVSWRGRTATDGRPTWWVAVIALLVLSLLGLAALF